MADPVTALTVVAAGATIGKGVMQYEEAESKETALDLQAKQNILTFQQKQLSTLDSVSKVLDRQEAQATVRGIDTSMSPSFNAIERETLNVGAKEGRNLNTESSLMERNVDIEKQNVKNTLYGQLFGDVAGAATSFASLQSKIPTTA
jgi:hypothetical protein